MDKLKISEQRIIQTITTIITNGYIVGFMKGKIFTGNSKFICVPGLNCYSCPGAVGSCPIGSLQAVLGGRKHNFSFYVLGFIMLFGVLLGRFVCGFLCPFGFLQDLLHKIKLPKIKVPKRIDKPLRYLKYAILLIPVILLPIFLTNQYGMAQPYFCQWICPAGTLEGGIPLLIKNEPLRETIGFLFNWKMGILVLIIAVSIFIYRPFCKYICPLGAFYSLFNKFSFYQMNVDKLKCNGCKTCEKQCKMNVKITKDINSVECIRCGECKKACPKGAITSGVYLEGTVGVTKTNEHTFHQ
ncbi:4Fe-4S binding protein [Anaerosalibacter massiliensis]|uniref:4Fe-4S binding protein n=1 Tax=Anaerosalibacter massiliensis TaxID=1347392 RepID=A0A9X2S6M9_9FIRM|nr:4Fe-4S binding protein [Anaerosalibacter massiliensis]MCR2043802.1 4Fe-4S binding protein [Anaerosalibacter massiliensis]